MNRVQHVIFLRLVPMTLCHEIGHLTKAENAFMNGLLDQAENALSDRLWCLGIKKWAAFAGRIVDAERKNSKLNASPKDAIKHDYYFGDIRETTAQLIGEALLHNLQEKHGIKMRTKQFAVTMPESFSYLLEMAHFIKPEAPLLVNPYEGTYQPPELS